MKDPHKSIALRFLVKSGVKCLILEWSA